MSPRTHHDFETALIAWDMVHDRETRAAAVAMMEALWPGLDIRPKGRSVVTSVYASIKGNDHAHALFYLNAHGKRFRDPELVKLAFGALDGMAAALEPERPRVEVYEIATGQAGMFWPLDVGASKAVALAHANNRMEELNGTTGRYGVRIIGAPDEDVAADFERAREAGYDVEPDGFVGGWLARDPEGEEIPLDEEPGGPNWPSERAAWEACDRHRRFGEA